MSFFSEANEDAYSVSPDAAATGRRVGFLESWAVGWNEQVRSSAMYGIENAMWNEDNAQVQALRRAGVENIPMLSPESFGMLAERVPGPPQDPGDYLATARFFEDGGDPAFASRLEDYDKRIDELRKTYPNLNLRTSREMWDNVRSTAQAYEQRANNDRRTVGGSVGAFIGGALASMNPNTDPLNFLTLGVGGAGRSIGVRIAEQAGAQGLIEGVNQITGVQEQRRLLGLDYGIGDAVSRVAGAAIGGAALQGAGEAVAFGIRRWFRSGPGDMAPPPTPEALERPTLPDTSMVPPQAIPADETLAAAKLTRAPETYVDWMHEQSPLSVTRNGKARTMLDVDYVTQRLDEWGGPNPWEMPPKTDTAVSLPSNDFVAPNLERFVERSQVDDIARTVDPDTFRVYDDLAQRKETYKRWIDELGGVRDAELQSRIDEIDTKIYDLTAKADGEGGKRAAKTRKDIQALQVEKAQVIEEAAASGKETPDMRRVRRAMMKDDEKMRDLAPLVSRAYARAQQKWANTDADRRAIVDMMRNGRQTLPAVDESAVRVADAVEALTLADRAPILQDAPKVQNIVARDADAADTAAAIVAENMKVIDDAITQYRANVDALLKTEKNGELEINGQSYKLNLDKDTIVVPNEEGSGGREISIRQLLEENKMDEYELEAVSTCSLRKTS